MRKRLISPIPHGVSHSDEEWLDLGKAAMVEVTSEQKDYPVESALVLGQTKGWRAADSGTLTIRLIFDEPQRLARIALVFEETEAERTQEFVLRWSSKLLQKPSKPNDPPLRNRLKSTSHPKASLKGCA